MNPYIVGEISGKAQCGFLEFDVSTRFKDAVYELKKELKGWDSVLSVDFCRINFDKHRFYHDSDRGC